MSGFGQSLSTATYKSNISGIAQRLSELTAAAGRQAELTNNITAATTALSNASTNQQPQQGTAERFYQRKDPTVLFGNITPGFENDFSDPTQVRLNDQGKYCQSSYPFYSITIELSSLHGVRFSADEEQW